MTDPAAAQSKQVKPKRRRWWWYGLGGVAFLIAAGMLGLWLAGGLATRDWEAYVEQLRAAGEPVTFEDIERMRPAVPDSENAALVLDDYADAFSALYDDLHELQLHDRLYRVYHWGHGADPDFFKGLLQPYVDATREFVERHPRILDASKAIRRRPASRIEHDWSDLPAAALPDLRNLRKAAQFARTAGMLALIDGRFDMAVEQFFALESCARVTADDPVLISALVRVSIEKRMLDHLQNILRAGELEDAQLVNIAEVLDRISDDDHFKWGLRGERALQLMLVQIDVNDYVASGPVPFLNRVRISTFVLRRNQLKSAQLVSRLVDASGDPVAMMRRAEEIEAEIPSLSRLYVYVKVLLPSLSKTATLHAELHVKIDCARAIIAAERFRLSTGRLPGSLNDLVPDYLLEVPPDPFSDAPIRMAQTDKGIVIYSVSRNGVDDGGAVTSESNNRTLDEGFRLVRPEHRGVVILEEEGGD